ncbi:MAG: DMT family transporter [candidate division Zixibacteria bacterium]|nr:DMT family transporter [candidate division Zixibacteria bacterium]
MANISSKSKVILADAGLFYAAAIWGATFILVKTALADIDAVVMVGYRFLLAGSVLLVYVLVTGRRLFEGLGRAFALAIMLWFLYIPQTLGLKYTTASNSGFITGLFVMFVPLFLRTIFKRRPTVMELTASFISLVGLWILTGGLRDINIGDILTLSAAMTYALHLLYSDKYMKAGIDPFLISCQQFLIVGLLSLLTALILDLPWGIATVKTGGIVVFLALFPTLSAFVIQMVAQKITSPLRVSLIFALEPVFAALFAWTWGGEAFIPHRALGGLFIFAALILSGLPSPGRNK